MNILNFLLKPDNKKNISQLLLFLAKITKKIPQNKTNEIKILVLKINKDIDFFNQKLSSMENSSSYLQITKGLKDISALMENISFELSFHKIELNRTLKTLLLDLERTLILLSKLIISNKQTSKNSALSIEIKQIFAQSVKEIKLAKTDISNDKDNFIENLKFSSIYNRMESCFIATDDISEAILALTKIQT